MAAWLPRAPPQLSPHCSSPRLCAALLVRSPRSRASPPAAGSAATCPDSRTSRARRSRTIRTWTIHYRSPHRRRSRAPTVVLPGLVRARQQPAAPGRDLPARPRRHRALERRLLRPAPRGRPLRRDQPGRHGPAAEELLVRCPRPDRRPGADARARRGARCRGCGSTARGSMRSAAAWAARRRCCSSRATRDLLAGAAALDSVTDLARRYHQLPQLPCARELPRALGQAVRRRPPVHARARGRRVAADEPRGYAARSGSARPQAIADVGCAAPDLVEHRGQDRVGSRSPVAGSLRGAAPARPLRSRDRVRRPTGRTRRRCGRARSCRSR